MQTTRRELIAAGLAIAAFIGDGFARAADGKLAGTDHLGRAITGTSPGGWRLVMFGYTHCPDVCPVGLQTLAETIDALGPLGERITPIFVTVDPARDTMDVLKTYLTAFDPAIIGLVGTPDQTEAAKASFGVFSENGKPDSSGFYTVNHTATVFLIGADGQFKGTIAYGEATDTALAKIKRLIAG